MIGFLFVSLVAAYIAIAAFVVTRLRTRRSRNITAIVLVILPFVEVTVARVRFEYLCRTEYALQTLDHTQRSTHLELRRGVQGGEVDYLRQLPWLDEVSNELSDGRFWVLSRRPNGAEETRFANQLPSDRLVLEEHRHRGWLNIRRYDLVVTSAATGSVVARSTEFVYWGDMLVRAFALRDGGTPHDWSCGRRIPIVEVLGGATGVAFNKTETESKQWVFVESCG